MYCCKILFANYQKTNGSTITLQQVMETLLLYFAVYL
jgi:hypothetical protein